VDKILDKFGDDEVVISEAGFGMMASDCRSGAIPRAI
jgi:hypothetical protein